MAILVAGGGIAGLAFALTCHEIGEEVRVFEAASEIKPLGVGINLQPNAVRELYQLGLERSLREIGTEAEEWALFYYGAHPVWTEPRGTLAGYNWPQFSVHRGQFQLQLLAAVRARLGKGAVISGASLVRYENLDDRVIAHFKDSNGNSFSEEGDLLVGADGIHSSVRHQMYPDQGNVHWNGAIMWRGVSRCAPPRTKNSFVMVGGMEQRFVCYPVEPLDRHGETLLNWIAELRPKNQQEVNQSDWNKPAQATAFMHQFQDWRFDWLDVPEIVSRAEGIWEYPMVDRDPVEHWTDGRAVLIGDAAHAMYPHGSNGATQAIVDTRVLGAAIQQHGLSTAALAQYEERQLGPVNELLMRARGEGPIGVLIDIEKRLSEGSTLTQAIDREEIENFMARYKQAAGFDRDALNTSQQIITV